MDTRRLALRHRMERDLGRKFDDATWDDLIAGGWSQDYETDPEGTVAALRRTWGLMSRVFSPRPASGSGQASSSVDRTAVNQAAGLDAPGAREVLVAELIAERARAVPAMVKFRNWMVEARLGKHAGSRLMNPEEVGEWLSAREAEDMEDYRAGRPLRFLDVLGDDQWGGGRGATIFGGPFLTSDMLDEIAVVPERLECWSPHFTFAGFAEIKEGGRIHLLARVSQVLSVGFGWPVEAAAGFVLTDIPWAFPRIAGGLRIDFALTVRSTITLQVDPDCTGRELLDFYNAVRLPVMGRGRGAGSSGKAAELLAFVYHNRTEGVTWEDLLCSWNKAHVDEAFADRSSFRRAVIRAERLVLLPDYILVRRNDWIEPPLSVVTDPYDAAATFGRPEEDGSSDASG